MQTKRKVYQLSSWLCLIRSSDVLTTQTFIPFIGFLLQEKVIKTKGEKEKIENKYIEQQEKNYLFFGNICIKIKITLIKNMQTM